MKYFTKQWYNLGENGSLGLLLKESKEAEIFSEDYYVKLYNKKLKEWLKEESEIFNLDNGEQEFDLKVATDNFNNINKNTIEDLKRNLPKEILEQVKDIRVLALNEASKEVKKEIDKLCAKCNKEMEKASRAYNKYLTEEFREDRDKDKIEIIRNLFFHDSVIIGTKTNKSNLTINIDNTHGFGLFNKIVMQDYEILKCEDKLEGSIWLYEEVYFNDNRIELHVLLWNQAIGEFEFTISAKNISFKNKVKPIIDTIDFNIDAFKKYIVDNKI